MPYYAGSARARIWRGAARMESGMRACVRACVRVCVHACGRAGVRAHVVMHARIPHCRAVSRTSSQHNTATGQQDQNATRCNATQRNATAQHRRAQSNGGTVNYYVIIITIMLL